MLLVKSILLQVLAFLAIPTLEALIGLPFLFVLPFVRTRPSAVLAYGAVAGGTGSFVAVALSAKCLRHFGVEMSWLLIAAVLMACLRNDCRRILGSSNSARPLELAQSVGTVAGILGAALLFS